MSGKSILVDTNIVISHLRGDEAITSLFESKKVLIPSIVMGELYVSVYLSTITEKQDVRLQEIDKLIDLFEIIFVDTSISKVYGQIKAELKLKGTPIPENDIWIAAIARQLKLQLISRDKHFGYVQRLTIYDL